MPNLGLGNNLQSESTVSAGARSSVVSDSYAINLDGSGDFLDLNADLSSYFPNSADWAMSAWIKVDIGNTDANRILFSTGDASSDIRWGVSGSNGYIQLNYDGVSKTDNLADIDSGNWHNIIVHYDHSETDIIFYTDGVKTKEYPVSYGSASISGADAIIGAASSDTSSLQLNAKIGTLSIFNKPLTAQNISDLSGNSGFDASSISGCQGWWRMGDGTENGSGTTIYDMSGNSNNGTLNGDPTIDEDTVE